jgi:hypothetical protein
VRPSAFPEPSLASAIAIIPRIHSKAALIPLAMTLLHHGATGAAGSLTGMPATRVGAGVYVMRQGCRIDRWSKLDS